MLGHIGCESQSRDGHLKRYERMIQNCCYPIERVLHVPIHILLLNTQKKTAITFANVFSWFLYAKAVQTTFGRRTKLFCDGSNVVNKWRSAYNSIRISFDKFNGLILRSLRGFEHMKRLCLSPCFRGFYEKVWPFIPPPLKVEITVV